MSVGIKGPPCYSIASPSANLIGANRLLTTIVALVVICLAMSTPESFRAGREMLKPYTRAAWIFNGVVVGGLVVCELIAKATTGSW